MSDVRNQQRRQRFSIPTIDSFQNDGSAVSFVRDEAHEQERGTDVRELLIQIGAMLRELLERPLPREWYTTNQFAKAIGLADVTVRGHCRSGRINSEKQKSGRGAHASWAISRTELLRYQREGLLPPR